MSYTPPPDTYDQPFIWVFDTTGLTSGLNYQNLSIYLKGGLGDFILRRIAGMKTVLNAGSGQYQIRDYNGDFIESNPVYSQAADQSAVVPELPYREQGQIRFDLYDIA